MRQHLETAVGRVGRVLGLVPHIAPLAATPAGREWRDRWKLGDKPLPDVAILVGSVFPCAGRVVEQR